jgi:putative PIN family toxin of toxin-antitoxin system
MPRYFLDANILISGMLWNGNERKLLLLGEKKKRTLLTSVYVLKEVEEVLEEFDFDEEKIAESLVYLSSFIELVDVSREETEKYWDALDDKDDVPVLAAAIKSKSILVTGDKGLIEKGKKYVTVKSTKEVLDTR